MKQELDDKLVKDFPLLYGDRHGDMRKTCMVWGFSCSDGWEPLIRELSSKLEPMIAAFYKEHKKTLGCINCYCSVEDHLGCLTNSPGKCLTVRKVSTKHITYYAHNYYGKKWLEKVKAFGRQLVGKIIQGINWILESFFYKLQRCHCEKYSPNIPRASQVKEKFGTLRFYMSGYLDGMDEHISEACRKSAVTCEYCGATGALRSDGGWLTTLCDKCAVDKNGNLLPTYDES